MYLLANISEQNVSRRKLVRGGELGKKVGRKVWCFGSAQRFKSVPQTKPDVPMMAWAFRSRPLADESGGDIFDNAAAWIKPWCHRKGANEGQDFTSGCLG